MLNELKPVQGARHSKKRLGRGIGSGLGKTAAGPVLSTIKNFRSEYEAHIYDKKCPAGVCKDLLSFVIDQDKCIKCGVCMNNCKFNAIVKK